MTNLPLGPLLNNMCINVIYKHSKYESLENKVKINTCNIKYENDIYNELLGGLSSVSFSLYDSLM